MNSLRLRIVWITFLSTVPMLGMGVAVILRLHRDDPAGTPYMPLLAGTVVLLLLGLIFAGVAGHFAIVGPLTRLAAQVARWREGATFDAAAGASNLRELVALSESFAAATAALDEQKARLQQATEQQELLMQEIHHRVKNNLQIVASLLNLQASRIRQPQAKAEFQSARDRVRALATLHRHLYAHGEVHTIDMREFLTELCRQLLQAMGETEGDRIRFSIAASEIQMSSDQAVPLALIVTEAVSNSLKYAFPGGRSGTVSVRLTTLADAAELLIQDDGVGLPAGRAETDSGTRDGLGLRLIRGFARQLGAKLEVTEGNGTRYLVTMPLARARTPSPQFAFAREGGHVMPQTDAGLPGTAFRATPGIRSQGSAAEPTGERFGPAACNAHDGLAAAPARASRTVDDGARDQCLRARDAGRAGRALRR